VPLRGRTVTRAPPCAPFCDGPCPVTLVSLGTGPAPDLGRERRGFGGSEFRGGTQRSVRRRGACGARHLPGTQPEQAPRSASRGVPPHPPAPARSHRHPERRTPHRGDTAPAGHRRPLGATGVRRAEKLQAEPAREAHRPADRSGQARHGASQVL
jgi:hypothetical protein